MDTDLLKTFLEVERTRHFGQAAYNLHLTQSAVSARVRLLEEQLGVSLFVRARKNIQLTRQGERLLLHAQNILQSWEKVRQELAVDEENPPQALRISGEFMLWDMFLQDWLHRLYQRIEGIVVQAEADLAEMMLRKLSDGVLDIGFVLDPLHSLDLQVREVTQLPLILVSSYAEVSAAQALQENYVQLDWGSQFALMQQQYFPSSSRPIAQFGLARLALNFLLEYGGSAYLPEHLCGSSLREKRLFRITPAPQMMLKVYVVYSPHNVRLQLVEDALLNLEQLFV